jgi:hypothetical protein
VIFVIVASSSVFAHAGRVQTSCGDERDKIIDEYVKSGPNFVPGCNEFSQGTHTEHFSFKELNTGDYAWAILRTELLSGVELIRTNFGGSLIINSAYRNPAHNDAISGAVDSRHVHGDAVDIRADQATWTTVRAASKNSKACVEPQALSGWAHVHADWRGACPLNW